MRYPTDESGVYVSRASEDGAVEVKWEGYVGRAEEEEEEEGEGEGESEKGSESEEEGQLEGGSESEEEVESEDEDYSSGRGCHIGIPIDGVVGGGKYNGEEWKDDGAGKYGDWEEEKLAAEDRMLWTCVICNMAVNIFARDDHIASRSHIRAVRKQADEVATPISPQSTYMPMWRCTMCDEEMSVFLREEHVFGKQHLRMIRKQQKSENGAHSIVPDAPPTPDHDEDDWNPPDEAADSSISFQRGPDTPELSFASYEYKLRNTFYCITCAAEFDLSMEEDHLTDMETWNCHLCSKTMHPASKEIHLQSEGHMTMQSIYDSQPDFYCEDCRRYYSPIDRERHLAGMDHERMVARRELEQRYQKRLDEELNITKASSSLPGALQLHTANKGKEVPTSITQDRNNWEVEKKVKWGDDPWVCESCSQPVIGMALSTHLARHCPLTGPRRTLPTAPQVSSTKASRACPEGFFFCDLCNKQLSLSCKKEHENGKKHRRLAANKKGKDKAKATSKAKGGAGKPKKPHVPKKKKDAIPAADKEYCEACNKYKRAAGMAAHMRSKKHRMNVASKAWAARSQVAGPSTQVAQPQPAPVIPPQLFPPQVAPPQLVPRIPPQPAPVVPPQSAPQALPQPMPWFLSQPAPWIWPQPMPQFQSQPVPPVLRQLIRPDLPPLAPWASSQQLPQALPQFMSQVFSQQLPRALPQFMPQDFPQPVSRALTQPIPQAFSQPAPQVLPQSAPRAQAVTSEYSNLPYVTILGDKFRCGVCGLERQLVEIESHMKSKIHERMLAATWPGR